MLEAVDKYVKGEDGTIYCKKTSDKYFKKCVALAKKFRRFSKKMGLKNVTFNYVDKDCKDKTGELYLEKNFTTLDIADVSKNMVVSFTLWG